jgi:hypothetical protein
VIREVDPAVLGEARMQRHVEHAGRAAEPHRRQSGERRRIEHAIADGTHLAARTHAHQEVAVRQRQQTPRPLDAVRHDTHADLLPEPLVDARLGAQRKPRRVRGRRPRLRKHEHRTGGHAGQHEHHGASGGGHGHALILGAMVRCCGQRRRGPRARPALVRCGASPAAHSASTGSTRPSVSRRVSTRAWPTRAASAAS